MNNSHEQAKYDADVVVIHFEPILKKLSEEEFFDFCMLNRKLPIELTSGGDLLILPPNGGMHGILNVKIAGRLGEWSKKDGTGQGFGYPTLFRLPNGAGRTPDVSWARNEKWKPLAENERDTFPPWCPDFVVELRGVNDSVRHLQEKMEEYVSNGAQLGWLVDPFERKVHVYRPGAEVEILDDPESVSGEPLLGGFALDVRALWE